MNHLARRAAIAAAAMLLSAAAAADVRYRVVDLGVALFEPTDREVPAVADNGWIAGTNTFPATRGYLWKDGAATFVEPTVPGTPTRVFDVNASGTVVGLAYGPGLNGPFGRPFVKTVDGPLTLMPDLAFAPSVNVRQAYGINDAGVVVGEWERTPFIYKNGSISALARPLDARGQEGVGGAFEINNQGVAIGALSYPGSFGAVVWGSDGSARNIGTLPLDAFWRSEAAARDINENNVVVGWSATSLPGQTRTNHAFRWIDGVWTDLGSLRGPEWRSGANAINDAGLIVGASQCVGAGGECAFLWSEQEGMLALDGLIDPAAGWHLGTATGINDAGWIVGRGTLFGSARDYLLLPAIPAVDEPASFALAAIGLAAVLLRRRSAGRGGVATS